MIIEFHRNNWKTYLHRVTGRYAKPYKFYWWFWPPVQYFKSKTWVCFRLFFWCLESFRKEGLEIPTGVAHPKEVK